MIARLSKITASGVVALLSACQGAGGYEPPPPAALAPPLTFDAITAPVDRTAHRELARLQANHSSPAARLRAAHIMLQTRQTDRALTKLNGMLFGDIDHGPAVESFARYLRAEAFEARGEVERARHERELALHRVVDPRLRRVLAEAMNPPEPEPITSARPKLAKIEPRSAWSARPAARMTPMGTVSRITIHHTAMAARNPSRTVSVSTLRAIQRNHQQSRGWSDIGYHYLIDTAGRVWQGRDARWQGAHAGNPAKNRGNLGVCLLGNFVRGRQGQSPTAPQVAALEALIESLLAQHRLGLDALKTHRELKVTSCPGPRLQAVVDRLRGFPAAAASR